MCVCMNPLQHRKIIELFGDGELIYASFMRTTLMDKRVTVIGSKTLRDLVALMFDLLYLATQSLVSAHAWFFLTHDAMRKRGSSRRWVSVCPSIRPSYWCIVFKFQTPKDII